MIVFRRNLAGLLVLSMLNFEVYANDKTLSINGAIRAKYTYNSFVEPSTSEFDFADAILWINYNKNDLTGFLDYRFYEYYGSIGDVSYLTNAWLKYQLSKNQSVTFGINPVPVVSGRYVGSTYFLSLLYPLGLEDISDFGIKYHWENSRSAIELGFYPTNAGHYVGDSDNSAHYSSNLTEEKSLANSTWTKEKNILTARLSTRFKQSNLQHHLGVSGWYSTVENTRTNRDGQREIWSVFDNISWNNFNLLLIYAKQNIDNKDDLYPDYSTFGAGDTVFNVANKGDILAAEISYTSQQKIYDLDSIKYYLNYSSYLKDKDEYRDSHRLIFGVSTSYKTNFKVYAEWLLAKHDVHLGDAEGLAKGSADQSWNNMIHIAFGYYF